MRILLAEDHPVNQKVALHNLKKLGYNADVVENGIEVLNALQQQPYDVVLMDVQMPEMDGIEASRRIRAQFAQSIQPYIIALSASTAAADRKRCREAGMDDYLEKPLYRDQLILVLEKATAHKLEKATAHKRE